MTLENLPELLVRELRDLYNAEQQVARALPKLADGVANGALAEVLRGELRATLAQLERLDRIFELLEAGSRGRKCAGMEGLLRETLERLDEPWLDLVRDAAVLGAMQRVTHYEVAAYTSVLTMSRFLGQVEMASLLSESLAEAHVASRALAELAEGDVMPKAMLVAEPGAAQL